MLSATTIKWGHLHHQVAQSSYDRATPVDDYAQPGPSSAALDQQSQIQHIQHMQAGQIITVSVNDVNFIYWFLHTDWLVCSDVMYSVGYTSMNSGQFKQWMDDDEAWFDEN